MVDFKAILGDDYKEDLTINELATKLQEKNVDLFQWDSNKYATKADYIKVEKQALDEKQKRKELASELDKFKQANMTAEEKAKAEYQSLLDQVEELKLDKTKSELKSMYRNLGYSENIVNELVDIDFYNGDDKLVKKADIMSRAKEELLSGYKKTILNNDPTPTTAPASQTSKKEAYKSKYQEALKNDRSDEASYWLGKAMQEGIDIYN